MALVLFAAAVIPTLLGCGGVERRDTPWVWTEPARTGWQPEPPIMPGRTPSPSARAPLDTHDASIAVFTGNGLASSATGAASRRDNIMGIRTAEALPDRLAWPTEQRPTLNRTRTLRSSTTADRWVYPTTRRDDRSRGRRHSGGNANGRGW